MHESIWTPSITHNASVLFLASSGLMFECLHFKSANPHCASQVIQGLLAVFYNLGDGDYNLTLPYHRLGDGEWHEVELDRYGREFTLRLDGGGGRREVTASLGRSQEIIIDPSVVMLGNSFPSGHNQSFLGRRMCVSGLNAWTNYVERKNHLVCCMNQPGHLWIHELIGQHILKGVVTVNVCTSSN